MGSGCLESGRQDSSAREGVEQGRARRVQDRGTGGEGGAGEGRRSRVWEEMRTRAWGGRGEEGERKQASCPAERLIHAP